MSDLVFVSAGLVAYATAWERQRQLHARRVADAIGDTCLLLEHHSVYTAGRGTRPEDRPLDGTPVIDVDRGGKITWHGPGQLTGYPIVKLPPLGGGGGRFSDREGIVDVVAHVRRLEEALIRVCAEFGVAAERVPGRSGVWVRPGGSQDQKVAAIGVRVSRAVTMHGFALNADPDLSAYDRIVPCGIRDASVTSLTELAGRDIGVAEVAPVVERHLAAVLGSVSTPTPRLPEPAHG